MQKDQYLSFITLTTIQAGIYICISAIMAGYTLFTSVGFQGSIIGIIIGSIVLWLLGLVFARLAVIKRKVLIELVADYFGKSCSQICGVALCISLIGWFAIQLELMSTSINFIYPFIPIWLSNVLLGSLIVYNVAQGMKSIGKFADFTVPFLLLMIIYITFQVYNPAQELPTSLVTFKGIFLIIAFSIVGIIDAPTYFCASKSQKDAYIATTIVYLIILPFMAIAGIVIALFTNTDDFIKAIMILGGEKWQISVMLFIVLAGWTTNNGNLYSASIAANAIIKSSHIKRTWVLGSIGVLLSCIGVIANFYETLDAMNIIATSLGAAIINKFLLNKLNYIPLNNTDQKVYLSIIAFSIIVGFISHLKWLHLTDFSFMNSFYITSILVVFYEGIKRWQQKLI